MKEKTISRLLVSCPHLHLAYSYAGGSLGFPYINSVNKHPSYLAVRFQNVRLIINFPFK